MKVTLTVWLLLGVQSNLQIHVSHTIKIVNCDVHLSGEGALNSTTAPTTVVGDSDVSNFDEQTEKWVCIDRVTLNLNDTAILLRGHCLTNKHVSFAWALLKKQFPSINGLKLALVAERHGKVLPSNGVQILLDHDNVIHNGLLQ